MSETRLPCAAMTPLGDFVLSGSGPEIEKGDNLGCSPPQPFQPHSKDGCQQQGMTTTFVHALGSVANILVTTAKLRPSYVCTAETLPCG